MMLDWLKLGTAGESIRQAVEPRWPPATRPPTWAGG